mmetsp:Transcript_33411/g.105538  ORF Transcript_33411/g.105538 Transcript_33411/m.105538 type:complete len:287 (+) Transcript_33411:145-1005(+)
MMRTRTRRMTNSSWQQMCPTRSPPRPPTGRRRRTRRITTGRFPRSSRPWKSAWRGSASCRSRSPSTARSAPARARLSEARAQGGKRLAPAWGTRPLLCSRDTRELGDRVVDSRCFQKEEQPRRFLLMLRVLLLRPSSFLFFLPLLRLACQVALLLLLRSQGQGITLESVLPSYQPLRLPARARWRTRSAYSLQCQRPSTPGGMLPLRPGSAVRAFRAAPTAGRQLPFRTQNQPFMPTKKDVVENNLISSWTYKLQNDVRKENHNRKLFAHLCLGLLRLPILKLSRL